MTEGNSTDITTSEIANKDEKPAASLLSLPSELRIVIYGYAIGDVRGRDGKVDLNEFAIPKLAQASRQFRLEVMPILATNMNGKTWVVVLPIKRQGYSWWVGSVDEAVINRERSIIQRMHALINAFTSTGFGSMKTETTYFSLTRARRSEAGWPRAFKIPGVHKGATWDISDQFGDYADHLVATSSIGISRSPGNGEKGLIAYYEQCLGVVEAKEEIEAIVAKAGFNGFTLENLADVIGAYKAAPL